MRSTLSNDAPTKELTINTFDAPGSEVFAETFITAMLDSYDALEATLTNTKNIKLASFPGEMFLTALH